MSTTTLTPLPLYDEPSLVGLHAPVHEVRRPSLWKRLLGFVGPGFLIAVGYMDPGNWATDIAGGARFGYTLLSVIMISNLMAILLQSLSLKLGIATGRDLAQLSHDEFGRKTNLALWLGAEISIAACDLAEVIGSAIALQLLFGIPLLMGVVLTAADVLALLAMERLGFRKIESLVMVLIATIVILFAIQLMMLRPDVAPALANLLIPSREIVRTPGMMLLAVGILGATVMPHNLYLHSSLVQSRVTDHSSEGKREAIRMGNLDSAAALTVALFVNAAILMVAAAAFHRTGHYEVAAIADAYKLLSPIVGTAGASTIFAVALLASGQNSSLTGTIAGQVVMEGHVSLRVAPWLRRLITRGLAIVPAIVVVALTGEAGSEKLLILSQVVLSIQLGFAVVPLVRFTSNKRIMGEFVNGRLMKAAAWSVTVVIVGLNAWMLVTMI